MNPDKKDINKMIEDTLNSMDHHNKATPQPFLLTRINARLRNGSSSWDRIVSVITRPAVALAGLVTVIIINIVIIFSDNEASNLNLSQQEITEGQGFSIATTTALYDIENIEP